MDGAVHFEQIPHGKGHDENEDGGHDEQDRHGVDVPENQ
jgi:hypothetical protein